jgi:hypothetical protein
MWRLLAILRVPCSTGHCHQCVFFVSFISLHLYSPSVYVWATIVHYHNRFVPLHSIASTQSTPIFLGAVLHNRALLQEAYVGPLPAPVR